MTEREMILKIESTIDKLRGIGLSTDSVERFFNVGEWLIAFEGLENLILDNEIKDANIIEDFKNMKTYFN